MLEAPNEKDILAIKDFVNNALVIELEPPIKYKTAEIRKQHKIKLPDAIIAATTIIHSLTLITRNIKVLKAIRKWVL